MEDRTGKGMEKTQTGELRKTTPKTRTRGQGDGKEKRIQDPGERKETTRRQGQREKRTGARKKGYRGTLERNVYTVSQSRTKRHETQIRTKNQPTTLHPTHSLPLTPQQTQFPPATPLSNPSNRPLNSPFSLTSISTFSSKSLTYASFRCRLRRAASVF